MRTYAFNIIFLVAAAQTSLFGQSSITLEECIALARSNYPLIRQHELLNKSAEYTISNANKAYLPQLSATLIGGYLINGLPGVSLPGVPAEDPDKVQAIALVQLNQTIWDGGATKAVKDITATATSAEKAAIDVQLFQVQDRVIQLYFGLLLMDEQLNVLELSEKNLKLNRDRLRLAAENGFGYRVEVDEMEAELLRIDQRRIEFRFTRVAYLDMLSHFVGRTLDPGMAIQRPVITDAVLAGTNARPEMTWYDHRTRLVERQAAMDKVSLMPKVGILGAGVFINPGMQFATSKVTNLAIVGISASWNTAGIYRNGNNRQLNLINMERIKTERSTFEFNQSMELKQHSAEIAKQRAVLQNDDKIVELKARIHQSLQLKFDNGLCSASELISSINSEQDARSNQRLHEIQLLKSLYSFKNTLGN